MNQTSLKNDSCLPFQIEGQDIKGRIVRLGPSVDEILSKHNYPDHINQLLGQVLALTALLGSMMKYDGILTVQMKGKGPLRVIVSDFFKDETSKMATIRAYAGFDEGDHQYFSMEELFGDDAYLAITMDQGKYMERYQGIVELAGENITQVAEEYFRSSEQLPTKVKLACEKDATGKWQAAAIMIQHYARSSTDEFERQEETTTDDWNNASIMLGSLKTSELLDDGLTLQNLLIRLYHESGVRIFPHTDIVAGCRCNAEKIRTALSGLDLEELKEVADDDIINVTCDFCTTDHKFELSKLLN